MAQIDTNQEIKQDTKNMILDAAERLFAREGFHNTSLRAITGEAGVNLAAVNYHFGSKVGLLDKVFERRLLPLNKVRQDKLQAVRDASRQENRQPGVKETLQTFIEPTLHFRDSGPGAKDFITLVGRSLSEPNDTARNIFIHHMEPLLFLLIDTLRKALPDLSADLVFWRLQFALGSMSHILRMTGKWQSFPEDISPDSDTELMTRRIMDFITSGMEAPG